MQVDLIEGESAGVAVPFVQFVTLSCSPSKLSPKDCCSWRKETWTKKSMSWASRLSIFTLKDCQTERTLIYQESHRGWFLVPQCVDNGDSPNPPIGIPLCDSWCLEKRSAAPPGPFRLRLVKGFGHVEEACTDLSAGRDGPSTRLPG